MEFLNGELVSVVIPVYNAGPYLRQCLSSVIMQTYSKLEIICVDDGSTDESLDILKEFSAKDSRIFVVQQERKFAGVARNEGLSIAKGKYICFLDADDFFEHNLIEKMYVKADEVDADFVICATKTYDEKRRKISRSNEGIDINKIPCKKIFSYSDIPEDIFRITSGRAWDKLYRVEFIKKENIKFQNTQVANDALFVYTAFAAARKIAFLNEKLVVHRINVTTSLEYNRHHVWSCYIEMLKSLNLSLKNKGKYEILKTAYVKLSSEILVWLLSTMKTYDDYYDLYMELKSSSIKKLDLIQNTDGLLKNDEKYNRLMNVINMDAKDYLLYLNSRLYDDFKKSIASVGNKMWKLPEQVWGLGTKVVVYGYGDVGKDFVSQIKNSNKLELVAVVDRNYKNLSSDNVLVLSLDEFLKKDSEYDFILVAVLEEIVSENIIKHLVEKGIARDKLIWNDLLN